MFPSMSPAWFKARTLEQAAPLLSQKASFMEKRPMTTQPKFGFVAHNTGYKIDAGPLALREKVSEIILDFDSEEELSWEAVDRIATILEDTGSPAHMRVAAELRGE